jgi:hypothetical protein
MTIGIRTMVTGSVPISRRRSEAARLLTCTVATAVREPLGRLQSTPIDTRTTKPVTCSSNAVTVSP